MIIIEGGEGKGGVGLGFARCDFMVDIVCVAGGGGGGRGVYGGRAGEFVLHDWGRGDCLM